MFLRDFRHRIIVSKYRGRTFFCRRNRNSGESPQLRYTNPSQILTESRSPGVFTFAHNWVPFPRRGRRLRIFRLMECGLRPLPKAFWTSKFTVVCGLTRSMCNSATGNLNPTTRACGNQVLAFHLCAAEPTILKSGQAGTNGAIGLFRNHFRRVVIRPQSLSAVGCLKPIGFPSIRLPRWQAVFEFQSAGPPPRCARWTELCASGRGSIVAIIARGCVCTGKNDGQRCFCAWLFSRLFCCRQLRSRIRRPHLRTTPSRERKYLGTTVPRVMELMHEGTDRHQLP